MPIHLFDVDAEELNEDMYITVFDREFCINGARRGRGCRPDNFIYLPNEPYHTEEAINKFISLFGLTRNEYCIMFNARGSCISPEMSYDDARRLIKYMQEYIKRSKIVRFNKHILVMQRKTK